MNFEAQILDYRNKINDELKKIYNVGPTNIKEPINHILKGGKRFRPILCLLTSYCCKGDQKSALIASTSIELLHNFTLIHDDIMDKDDLRHGNITIHNKWNESIAILSGDAILSLALINLNDLSHNKSVIIEKFNKALIKVCEGQALDLEFQDNTTVSEEAYMSMIDKKTGYMVSLCSEIGAIISNESEDIQKKLKKYGLLIGRAFQIQDDLLEVISDQNKMGKSLKSDFLLNKKTYLSIKTNLIDSSVINKYIKIAQKDFNLGFSLYRDFLKNNNIINETNDTIAKILKSAEDILNSLDMDTEYLHKYTRLILHRDA